MWKQPFYVPSCHHLFSRFFQIIPNYSKYIQKLGSQRIAWEITKAPLKYSKKWSLVLKKLKCKSAPYNDLSTFKIWNINKFVVIWLFALFIKLHLALCQDVCAVNKTFFSLQREQGAEQNGLALLSWSFPAKREGRLAKDKQSKFTRKKDPACLPSLTTKTFVSVNKPQQFSA